MRIRKVAGSSYPRSTVATSASFSVLPPAIIGVSPDLLQVVERPVEADKDLPAPGLDSPGGGQHILAVQRGKNRLRRETQSGETVMRKREINALRLFAEDIHFFHPGYMQQLLA